MPFRNLMLHGDFLNSLLHKFMIPGLSMARTYKRKKPPRKYTDADVSSALNRIKNDGLSVRQAAKEIGIPKSTLFLFQKQSSSSGGKKKKFIKKGGLPFTLNEQEERRIVNIIKFCAELGWPLDRDDISKFIGEFCQRMSKKTRFKDGKPGQDFLRDFLRRNNDQLSTRRGEILKVSRAKAEDPAIISDFIDTVKSAFDIAGINKDNLNDAKRIFNADESGFNTKGSFERLIVGKGKDAQQLRPTEGKTNYSVLVCGNAAGQYVPPYVVYKGTDTTINCAWTLNGPPNAAYSTSKSGWMDAERFSAWLPWFDSRIEEMKIQKPVVVLMDGYSSHLSIGLLEIAKERNIILVKLPPNSTHILQALDVSVFGPVKKLWKNTVKSWYRQTHSKSITKAVFPVLFGKVFQQMEEKPELLISGFKSTGVWPLDKSRILSKVEKRGVYKTVINSTEATATEDSPQIVSSEPSVTNTGTARGLQCTTTSRNEQTPRTSKDHETSTAVTEANDNSESGVPSLPMSPIAATQSDSLVNDSASNKGTTLSPASKLLSDIIKDHLTPSPDEHTRKALQNMKNTKRMKKGCAQIVTESHVIESLRKEQEEKAKKKEEVEKRKADRKLKKEKAKKKGPKKKIRKTSAKRKVIMDDSSNDEEFNDLMTQKEFQRKHAWSSCSDDDNEQKEDGPNINEEDHRATLQKFWTSVSPPVKENEVVGKWYCGVYTEKDRKKTTMCVGRATQRFLDEKDGNVTHLELDCLKPQIGNDFVLEAYPEEQSDRYVFAIQDVFYGPMECTIPRKKRAWRFPHLNNAKEFFEHIKDVDRESIFAQKTI